MIAITSSLHFHARPQPSSVNFFSEARPKNKRPPTHPPIRFANRLYDTRSASNANSRVSSAADASTPPPVMTQTKKSNDLKAEDAYLHPVASTSSASKQPAGHTARGIRVAAHDAKPDEITSADIHANPTVFASAADTKSSGTIARCPESSRLLPSTHKLQGEDAYLHPFAPPQADDKHLPGRVAGATGISAFVPRPKKLAKKKTSPKPSNPSAEG